MRFIESILLRDGVYHNISLHQERVNRVFEEYSDGIIAHDLERVLPKLQLDGIYKVRIVYDMDTEDASYDIEYAAYTPRKIRSLEVVRSNPFDYSHKFEDRSMINRLVEHSEADDIIIAIDETITDGSYFNLAFFDGKEWLTPDTPLLNGVRRQQLLAEKRITEKRITVSDLESFQEVSLINAMLDLGDLVLPVEVMSLPKSDA